MRRLRLLVLIAASLGLAVALPLSAAAKHKPKHGQPRHVMPGPGQGGSTGGGGNGGGQSQGQFGTPPVLENFQLRVGTYDPSTGKAGDLVFSRAGLQPQFGLNSVFLEFGHQVHGQVAKDLPHFTFYAPLGTQVIAPANGVVVFIDDKAGETDKSLTMAPDHTSHWGINLDHIQDMTVKVGDTVHAGEVLGTVGTPEGGVPGWGANELSVKMGRDQDAGSMFVCPWAAWDPATVKSAQATISKLMSDWEAWYGDSTVYDEASQVSPGCDMQSEPIH